MELIHCLYVNVNFAADVLYIRVNSNVICKIESEVLCSSRERYDIVSNEREVQFKSCVQLLGRIRRHSVHKTFNCNLFSIIQYLT